MAITDQLGAPASTAHMLGRYTLHKYVRCEASAGGATAVAWANLSSIESINIDPPTWEMEADILQQGGGDEKTHIQRGPRWNGTINVLGGHVGTILALLKGLTWTTAGTAALAMRQDKDLPEIILQSINRDSDNVTHRFTRVIQDIIIDDMGDDNPMDYADRAIPFHTYHEPFYLCSGAELVYHVWAATPSTVAYTTSNSTPLTLIVPANHDDWYFTNMVFCKVKDNSAGNTVGIRRASGVSLSGGTLTFTTGTPAATDVVYMLYAVAT